MTTNDQVFFFDTTLRDGEQSPGCTMHTAEKLRLAHQLAHLGVDVLEDGADAFGEAVSAGDKIAGDDDQIRLEFVHPPHELDEVSPPDDGAVMQIRDLHDFETGERGIEIGQGHLPAVDIDPAAIDRQSVNASEAQAGHAVEDGLAPAELFAPLGDVEIFF